MPVNHNISSSVRAILLACSLGLVHCPGAEVRKAVVVTLQPPADSRVPITQIRVVGTLEGRPSTSGPQLLGGEMVPFTLLLPPGASGRFVVEIDARSSDLLQVATGRGEVLLGTPDEYELTIPLRRAFCRKPGWCFDDPASRSLALRAVWGRSDGDVWAVGEGGTVLHYDGFCWAVVPTEATEDLFAVWGSAQGDLWYAGAKGTLIRHHPGSPRRFDGLQGTIFGMWGSAPDDVWVVGQGGLVARFDGQTWSIQGAGVTEDLHAIWGSGAQDVWVAGQGGALLHHQDGQWKRQRWVIDRGLYALWGAGPQDVWVAGEEGTLLHYQAGQWKQEPISLIASLYALWGAGPQDVWVAGQGGVLMHRAGDRWGVLRAGSPTLFGLWGSSARTVWAVGLQGMILRRDEDSLTVVHMGPPPAMR